MPKVQVYLSDDLHAAMTQLALVPSHLLQDAVRREVAAAERRQAAQDLIDELDAVHGPPSARGLAAGRAWAAGILEPDEPRSVLSGSTAPAVVERTRRRAVG